MTSAAPASQKIWLDDVRCAEGSTHWTGRPATKLHHCYNAGVGLHNCTHEEDVHLRCVRFEHEDACRALGRNSRTCLKVSRSETEFHVPKHAFSEASRRRSADGPLRRTTAFRCDSQAPNHRSAAKMDAPSPTCGASPCLQPQAAQDVTIALEERAVRAITLRRGVRRRRALAARRA